MLLSKNSNLRLSALKVISLFTLLICVQGDQQKRHRTSSQARSETNVADRSSRWDDVESISESSGRYLGSENDYYYSMSYSYSKSKSKSKSQSEDEDNNGGKSLGDNAVPDEEEDPDTPPVTKSTVPPETTIKPTEDIESEDEPEDESEATIITSEAAMPAEKFMCDLEGAGISTDTELTETLISYYYDVQTSDDSKDWIGTLEQVMLGAISGMIDCDEKLISYDSSGKKIHRLLQSEVKVLGIDSKPGDVPTNGKFQS
uniref:Uncharacterized protein n=1 Tax=Corethron hystrix TaxID=216773 RepID=A0A7S1B7P4_9STRA|mmetsp:Transcript_14963/g.33344  ORF Transcript_14963/g.33344 Transcript_14963/m.33344 type:complete len:259 (+) Transcript_14963:233-1009(+)